MSKQAQVVAIAATTIAAVAAPVANRNLFVTVNTFEAAVEGSPKIGSRVVDMYHYGTRNWLSNHMWWATHNGHVVEIKDATDDEVTAYIETSKQALADKF